MTAPVLAHVISMPLSLLRVWIVCGNVRTNACGAST